ncbi:hypothetical protein [Gallaecimonas xiamenensis]|uniref:Uncharacterized protein n=1 Tax=Gallaecimonas xiamenensis 3-C-1 TaxID=745411 RepID=K2JTC7_9GAMM|nr:hypothetical protein [Gallaecimonas xiamenensis]EKE68425.1 hypothetical protein B3C1_17047 [Gallaecimonas xiamenensis 3-C-1]
MLKPRQQAKTVVNRPQLNLRPELKVLGKDELALAQDVIDDFGWKAGDQLLVSAEGGSLLVTNLSQRDVAQTRFNREARSLISALEDDELPLRRVRVFFKGELVQVLEADEHECDEHCSHD